MTVGKLLYDTNNYLQHRNVFTTYSLAQCSYVNESRKGPTIST